MNSLNHKDTKAQREAISNEVNELSRIIVDAAYAVHTSLGAGLLESVYEVCLCHELEKRGIAFQKQVSLPVVYDGITLEAGLRLDIWVDKKIIIELKAVEQLNDIHKAQVLTYLKLTGNRLGLLINFNTARIKDGIKRVIL
jgi:GxxExxY protein